MRYRAPFLALFFSLATALMFAQTPAAATQAAPAQGAIDIVVVNAITGEPIPDARVKLAQPAPEVEPIYGRTDAQGHFQFAKLGLIGYMLSVERPGLIRKGDPNSGRPSAMGVNLTPPRAKAPARTLAPPRPGVPNITRSTDEDGTQRATVRVEMIPGAVVTGKIVDPNGVPVSGVQVALQRKAPIPQSANQRIAPREPLPDGKSELQTVNGIQSDDRGEFRFGQLPPGTYYVRANRPFDWGNSYHNTYFPHALDVASATPIELAAGQQARADILIVHQNGVRVAGRITDSSNPDSAVPNSRYTSVALVSRTNVTIGGNSTMAAIDSGRFEIRDVLPGAYTLVATTFDSGGNPIGVERKAVSGMQQPIDVADRDMEDVAMELRPLPDLTGTVTYADGCPAAPVRVIVQGNPVFGRARLEAPSDSSGRFVLSGLTPGHYTIFVSAQGPSARQFVTASARLGDREVLKEGFDYPPSGTTTLQIASTCNQPAGRAQ